jgi:hypothetical protein
VGVAAPIVAALVKGTGKEIVVSELYGGEGGEQAATDPVYTAIGDVRISSLGNILSSPVEAAVYTAIGGVRIS